MIPLVSSRVSLPPPPAGQPPLGPHCCSSRREPGGGGPGRLRRLRPHLSNLAAVKPRGELGRGPLPRSPAPTHPGCCGEWARATLAGLFICLLILSPRLPRRVVTQKRGTWCQLNKSLSNESCHPEVPLSETPRIPPRLLLSERQGPCTGYLGCRREVVQVTGWSGEGPGPGAGAGVGPGGAGWRLHGPTPCRWPGWRDEGWAVGVAFYLCDRGGVSFPQGISTITL